MASDTHITGQQLLSLCTANMGGRGNPMEAAECLGFVLGVSDTFDCVETLHGFTWNSTTKANQTQLVNYNNFFRGKLPSPGAGFWFPSANLVQNGTAYANSYLKSTLSNGWGWSPLSDDYSKNPGGINDQTENFTRFVVVGPRHLPCDTRIACKTSLIFVTRHEQGALVACLNVLERAFDKILVKCQTTQLPTEPLAMAA